MIKPGAVLLVALVAFGIIDCFTPQKGPQDFNHSKALIENIFITDSGDTAIVLRSKGLVTKMDTFYVRKNK